MNILLIQLKRIGDLVLTTPAISALRTTFPEAEITLVASSTCRELLPAIPNLDDKLVVNRLDTWIEVARCSFDYCVDFTRNDRSSWLTRLSRANTRVAIERRKQRATFRSRAYNTFVSAPLGQLHTADHVLKLLAPLGVAGEPPQVTLEIPVVAHARADELRSKCRVRQDFIIFHPGSARAEKFWEPDRWAEVIEHARKAHAGSLVLTGGDSELEQEHIGQIKRCLLQPIVDLSGQTGLLTLAALVSKARMLVTVDSAPMHFAAAAQTPQIDLFGPTNPFHWRPRGSNALILRGESKTPLREFSPNQPAVPMKQISTRAVIDAMDALLSSPIAKGS
jgi:predicted lipopolysaccharide heptosyltransferase III